MKAPKNKPKSDPTPQGTYPATCYCVVDWGTHLKKSTMYGDKLERQVRIQWEIPSIRIKYMKDDKEAEGPKVAGKTYKFSTYKKSALAIHLSTWGFTDLDNLDFKGLIGKSCFVNIAHGEGDDGVYSYVQAVMQATAGSPDMPLENPEIYYSIEENGLNIPSNVYEFMSNKIKESPEYKELTDTPPQQQESQFTADNNLRTDDQGPPPVDTTNYGGSGREQDIPFIPCD